MREKTAILQLRLTPAQKQVIKWASERSSVSMTEYVVSTVCEAAAPEVPDEMIDELVALAAQERGVTVEEFTRATALEAALKIIHDGD